MFPTVRSSRYIVFDRKSMPMVACGAGRAKEEKERKTISKTATMKVNCLSVLVVVHVVI